MKGFILMVIAIVLLIILSPIGLVIELISFPFKKRKKQKLNDYWLGIAIGIDQIGNVICASFFNLVLIHHSKARYEFGHYEDTISDILGRNKLDNNLTKAGKLLDRILDYFDPNHSIKSIDLD